MKVRTDTKKPLWRTASEYNPVVGRREVLLVGSGIAYAVALYGMPFLLHSLAGVSVRTGFLLTIGSAIFVPQLVWLVLLAFHIPRQIRSSNALWRKRMASGFYKTLPLVKDDDDD
jgi:hypothetical protein